MGVGKSTVGRALAIALHLDFRDSDEALERRNGVSVTEIFTRRGEACFRSLESECLRELLEEGRDMVLATGGGVVLDEDNRRYLKAWGKVFYLRTSLEELLGRLEGAPRRPLLQGADPAGRLRKILAQRAALYEEVADWVVDCKGFSVSEIVDKMCRCASLVKR